MRRFTIGIAAAIIASACSAGAQTNGYGETVPIVATAVSELQPLLEVGTTLQVVDAAGTKVRGTLASLQPPSFGTLAKRRLVLADQPLRAWWADDPVSNGVHWGFWSGLGGGLLFTSRACMRAADTSGQLGSCTVLGSVGFIVDSLIHRRELHVDYRTALPAP